MLIEVNLLNLTYQIKTEFSSKKSFQEKYRPIEMHPSKLMIFAKK